MATPTNTGFSNIKRVIDYTLLYAKNLEETFRQVAEYLTLVGRNGIILNSEKSNLLRTQWTGQGSG